MTWVMAAFACVAIAIGLYALRLAKLKRALDRERATLRR